jgi:predicted transcriptional regulator
MDEMQSAPDPQPLLTHAAQRTREIAALCRTVERGCRAIGFRPDSSHEHVATLIARLAGEKVLRRTIAEIAADPKVDCSERQARRAVDELVEFGLITLSLEPMPPTRRRGRPSKVYLLTLQMDEIRKTVAEADKWAAQHRGEVVANVPNDLRTSERRPSDITSAKDRQNVGETPAKDRHFDDHTVFTLNTNTPPPPPDESEGTTAATVDWISATDDVRSAGVDRARQLVTEARQAGFTPSELADAAYVVRFTSSLNGGALFDHVRSGGWPTSGVKPAQVIRDQRAKRADQIRAKTRSVAPDNASERLIIAASANRLVEAGLYDQITDEEQEAREAWLALQTQNAVEADQ